MAGQSRANPTPNECFEEFTDGTLDSGPSGSGLPMFALTRCFSPRKNTGPLLADANNALRDSLPIFASKYLLDQRKQQVGGPTHTAHQNGQRYVSKLAVESTLLSLAVSLIKEVAARVLSDRRGELELEGETPSDGRSETWTMQRPMMADDTRCFLTVSNTNIS